MGAESGVLVERVVEWGIVTYDVTKINERGRRQARVLRLTSTHIQNVRDKDSITSSHAYLDVFCVTLTDQETLLISYADGSHDYTYVSPIALQIAAEINQRLCKKREKLSAGSMLLLVEGPNALRPGAAAAAAASLSAADKHKHAVAAQLNRLAIRFQEKMHREQWMKTPVLKRQAATMGLFASTTGIMDPTTTTPAASSSGDAAAAAAAAADATSPPATPATPPPASTATPAAAAAAATPSSSSSSSSFGSKKSGQPLPPAPTAAIFASRLQGAIDSLLCEPLAAGAGSAPTPSSGSGSGASSSSSSSSSSSGFSFSSISSALSSLSSSAPAPGLGAAASARAKFLRGLPWLEKMTAVGGPISSLGLSVGLQGSGGGHGGLLGAEGEGLMLGVVRQFMDSLRCFLEVRRVDDVRRAAGLPAGASTSMPASLSPLTEEESMDFPTRVERAVESAVVLAAYPRLLSALRRVRGGGDDATSKAMSRLRGAVGLNQAYYGIPPEHHSALNWHAAIEELNAMDQALLPADKLKCLCCCAKAIYTGFNRDRSARLQLAGCPPELSPYLLTSDEFMPIFLFVVANSALQGLDTTVAFLWGLADRATLNGVAGSAPQPPQPPPPLPARSTAQVQHSMPAGDAQLICTAARLLISCCFLFVCLFVCFVASCVCVFVRYYLSLLEAAIEFIKKQNLRLDAGSD